MAEPTAPRTRAGGLASPAAEACLRIAIITINVTRVALLMDLAVQKTPSVSVCVRLRTPTSLYGCGVSVEVPTPCLPV